jgi:tetratricopeptide (TPR) repeat protein
MPSIQLYYMLPGSDAVQGPVSSDWLWAEVHEGRITANAVVCESRGDTWRPFRSLTDDLFSTQVVAKASESRRNSGEAEQLHLKATFLLIKCQAHIQVYKSRSQDIIEKAQNGIEFVDEAIRLMPNNANYINTKALLLSDGLGQRDQALSLLNRAAEIAPNDIQIKQNLRTLSKQADGCLGVIILGLIGTISAGASVVHYLLA